MRVLLFGFGSRGDVQPYIALGKGLQRAGYAVTVAAGANFGDWITREGLGFAPIQVDIEAEMQTDIGKNWLSASSHNAMAELRSMRRMVDNAARTVGADIVGMIDRYDAFISSVLTVDALAAACAARGKHVVNGLMSPWSPTRSGAAGMNAPLPTRSSLMNWLTGYIVEWLMGGVLAPPSRATRRLLALPPPTRRDFIRAWNQTPTLLGISPLVTPPPPDWDAQLHITGYWFLDTAPDWQPPPALTDFLAAGDAPVYIGFGSMSSADPQGTLKLILEAAARTGERVLIHRGWAQLAADSLPTNVLIFDGAPHAWLFPRMKAIIHHGGAGTTGAGVRSGIPSGIVAHIGDQPYWGRRLHELGVGAAPIRRHHLSADNLAAMIRSLTTDAGLRARAAALGERIRAEDGVGTAVRAFAAITGT